MSTRSDIDIVKVRKVEDTKEVIRIRKSKMDRQYNDQEEIDKRTNNDLQKRYTEH
jgi:hypothetical protein